jgi:hypothetical protein
MVSNSYPLVNFYIVGEYWKNQGLGRRLILFLHMDFEIWIDIGAGIGMENYME